MTDGLPGTGVAYQSETPCLILTVPGSPPTKSNTYQIVRTGAYFRLAKTKLTRDYEQRVTTQVKELLGRLELAPPAMTGRVMLTIVYHQGNARRRDLSNTIKAIEDALTRGGIWADDSQVDRISIMRAFDAPDRSSEWVEIIICPIG